MPPVRKTFTYADVARYLMHRLACHPETLLLYDVGGGRAAFCSRDEYDPFLSWAHVTRAMRLDGPGYSGAAMRSFTTGLRNALAPDVEHTSAFENYIDDKGTARGMGYTMVVLPAGRNPASLVGATPEGRPRPCCSGIAPTRRIRKFPPATAARDRAALLLSHELWANIRVASAVGRVDAAEADVQAAATRVQEMREELASLEATEAQLNGEKRALDVGFHEVYRIYKELKAEIEMLDNEVARILARDADRAEDREWYEAALSSIVQK